MQLPSQLIESIRDVPGFDEATFRAIHESGTQVTSIRLNPKKVQPGQEIAVAEGSMPVPWCDTGLYLAARPSFTLDPLLHAGAYYVQEASSMFLWHVLRQVAGGRRDQRVLDLCAAPGGKSTLLSSFFTEGIVVSNEVIKTRAGILQENITKWGDANVVVTNNDSRDFSRLPSFFDVVVTDVPCSGSGLFRRDPSAIAEWSTDNVNLCCQRQQRILADIIPSLREEGVLIYSTCSYSTEEDEDILDWMVEEFRMQPITVEVPAEWQVVETVSKKHGAKGYRFFPDKVKGEGFFIAALRQGASAPEGRRKEGKIMQATLGERTALQDFVMTGAEYALFKQGDTLHIFPAAFMDALKVMSGQLYIKQAGIAAGSFKGKGFVPDHALALSQLKTSFTVVAFDKATALSYLRKQDIQPVATQGWCLVTYEGLGLGWLKNLGNRVNNYYPSEWRILKG